MEFDNLTKKLYKENINWIYSIIKDLDIPISLFAKCYLNACMNALYNIIHKAQRK